MAVVPRSLLDLHRHQRIFAAGFAVGQQLRVPGHFLGRVPQEVGRREPFPGARDLGRGDAAGGGQQLARAVLRFAHQLVGIDRALEAAAQRALHAFVEFLEQRRLPGIPQLRIGAAHVGAGEHV